MADSVLAIPSVYSFLLLIGVFALHGRYWSRGLDAGDFARLQLYTCVGGFISACGSCVHSLGFYTVDSPGRWCLFEAVCSSFGELSVILWLIMTCVYFYAHLKEYTISIAFRRRLFIAFHCSVWIPAGVLTVVPWGMGLLGLNTDENSEYWCWFVPDQYDWEWVQFYAPLVVYSVVSVVAFIYCLAIIWRRLRSPLAATNTPTDAAVASTTGGAVAATTSAGGGSGSGSGSGSDQLTTPLAGNTDSASTASLTSGGESDLTLYMRIALQFFVLFVVFLPDLFVVLVDTYGPERYGSFATDSEHKSLYAGSRGAEFLWKCEGLMVGLLYLLNGRVRTLFWCLPEVHSALWRLGHRPTHRSNASTAASASVATAHTSLLDGNARRRSAAAASHYQSVGGVEVVGKPIGGGSSHAEQSQPAAAAITSVTIQPVAPVIKTRRSSSVGVRDQPRSVEDEEDDSDTEADGTHASGGSGKSGDRETTISDDGTNSSAAASTNTGSRSKRPTATVGAGAIDHSHDAEDALPPPPAMHRQISDT